MKKVNVSEGKALLEDGTLAGSVLKMNEAMMNMLQHTSMCRTEIVASVTKIPAQKLGLKKGELKITVLPELDLKQKQVLIVDDIFDTGESLKLAYDEVMKRSPEIVKTCVFLDKQIEKRVDIRPDFIGFEIPDYFVVGYGLDINEMYRDLPYIGYFKRGE